MNTVIRLLFEEHNSMMVLILPVKSPRILFPKHFPSMSDLTRGMPLHQTEVSRMRELSIEDVRLQPNEENTTVVTGDPGGGTGPDTGPGGDGGNGGGDNGGGGGTGGGSGAGYSNPNHSDAANRFADSHVVQTGTAPGDKEHADHLRDVLAKLWDYAHASIENSNQMVDIGNGKMVALGNLMGAIEGHAMFYVTDLNFQTQPGAGMNTGAVTSPLPGYGGNIGDVNVYFNHHNQDGLMTYDKQWDGISGFDGASGENYVIFHEVGHAMNYYWNNSSFNDEAAANTAGRSIEQLLGLDLLSRGGVAVEPLYGYH